MFDGVTALVDRQLARTDALNPGLRRGRLTGITDNVTPANNQTFGYSAANRLTSASGAYGAYSWTFDLVGNRTGETLGATADTYTYPATNNRIAPFTRGGSTIQQRGLAATCDRLGLAP